jgi:hypothetical protein
VPAAPAPTPGTAPANPNMTPPTNTIGPPTPITTKAAGEGTEATPQTQTNPSTPQTTPAPGTPGSTPPTTPGSGAGSGERALCNSTGKHATNEFHRESAPEQSGCESGHS